MTAEGPIPPKHQGWLPTCFPFHDWRRWETVQEGNVLSGMPLAFGDTPPDGWRHTGFFIRQRRECNRCGKIKLRTHKSKM